VPVFVVDEIHQTIAVINFHFNQAKGGETQEPGDFRARALAQCGCVERDDVLIVVAVTRKSQSYVVAAKNIFDVSDRARNSVTNA